ncbi:MAG: tetratricopeptide repeat protein, partial [Acidobacteriota bacterium]
MSTATVPPANLFRRAAGLFCRWFAPGTEWGRESLWRQRQSEAVKEAGNHRPFEAEQKLIQALEIAESFGEADGRRLESIDNLAAFYESTGSYSQAEPLYRKVLEIREKELGPDHFQVADSLNNLALLYYTQGKNQLAEPLLRRLVQLVEKTRGPQDRELAVCLENYAALMRRLDRKDESDRLRARAKEIRKGRSQESGIRNQEEGSRKDGG